MVLIVSLKSNLTLSYLVSVAAGVSVAASFLLPWWASKNPDFCVCWWLFSLFKVIFKYGSKVNASRCGGWLQSQQSRHSRPWSSLLLFLCVLHQVCLWLISGYFYSQSKVSSCRYVCFLMSHTVFIIFSKIIKIFFPDLLDTRPEAACSLNRSVQLWKCWSPQFPLLSSFWGCWYYGRTPSTRKGGKATAKHCRRCCEWAALNTCYIKTKKTPLILILSLLLCFPENLSPTLQNLAALCSMRGQTTSSEVVT